MDECRGTLPSTPVLISRIVASARRGDDRAVDAFLRTFAARASMADAYALRRALWEDRDAHPS